MFPVGDAVFQYHPFYVSGVLRCLQRSDVVGIFGTVNGHLSTLKITIGLISLTALHLRTNNAFIVT